jgi:hybrid cluster-associated redox disulfide protein
MPEGLPIRESAAEMSLSEEKDAVYPISRYNELMASSRKNPVPARKKEVKKEPPTARIHRAMPVGEIVGLLPESEKLLAEYGLHCFNCSANMTETLEEGYLSHGFEDDSLDALVADLNEMLANRPPRPQTLTVTKEAAQKLHLLASSEGKADEALQVGTDEVGGFCMEFRKQPEEESLLFFHREVPEMRLFATSDTLQRIGGSTIDFREGRFKLDLAEAMKGACACGGSCKCK